MARRKSLFPKIELPKLPKIKTVSKPIKPASFGFKPRKPRQVKPVSSIKLSPVKLPRISLKLKRKMI